jgi:FeS assembly SUF system protein
MSEPQSSADDIEHLKRRRLGVLNTSSGETPPFTLEGEGTEPDVAAGGGSRALRDRIVQGLKTVYDPEIPLNIYDLGLVYDLDVTDDGNAHVKMTLTAPGCPVAGSLVQEVHDRVRATKGVRHAKTELVWDPPWTKDRLSLEARLELGLL